MVHRFLYIRTVRAERGVGLLDAVKIFVEGDVAYTKAYEKTCESSWEWSSKLQEGAL